MDYAVVVHVVLATLDSPRETAIALVRQATKIALASKNNTQFNTRQSPNSLLCILTISNLNQIVGNTNCWKSFQSVISSLYFAAAQETFNPEGVESGSIWLPINIILQGWCGYDVWDFAAEKVWVCMLVEARSGQIKPKLHSDPRFLDGNVPEHIQLDISEWLTNHPNDLQESSDSSEHATDLPPVFGHVAVGGTFDYLHAGHRILLTCSAWLTSTRLICGVTDLNQTSLERKQAYQNMQSLQTRLDGVKTFLHRIKRDIMYDIIPIYDDYGPTLTDELIEAIVCSRETIRGCKLVNDLRQQGNLKPLHIFIIDVISSSVGVITSQDFRSKISSTYLRLHMPTCPHSGLDN
ncbi:hypothetical protein BDV3_002305 [Batrachochytrium dendrobatidis]|nr:hypothetical protein O5D80_001222 [Batrachochytrium dendrobatidis]KAK5667752.1 hypothetical protein QVD99_005597 [Batrachochytrium dendrobatidis]OAJ44498.1 hypothetical protein BDEG_27720 [Batrachochytrium dendrobatidis JEL423]